MVSFHVCAASIEAIHSSDSIFFAARTFKNRTCFCFHFLLLNVEVQSSLSGGWYSPARGYIKSCPKKLTANERMTEQRNIER